MVMPGGHLDSWTAATGLTGNGAGCIVALEAAFVYFAAMRSDMMPRKPLGQPEKFIFDDLIP
jgi:hypothetical protein